MADNETTTTPVTAAPAAAAGTDAVAGTAIAEHTTETTAVDPLKSSLNSLVAKDPAPAAGEQPGTDGDTRKPVSDISTCP